MDRYLKKPLFDLLGRKILLLTGPRQVGKTTLSKALMDDFAYYNYDIKKDLRVFKDQEWDDSKKLVIFDELHKMKKWKLCKKGIYDEGRTEKQQFLVSGSARLDLAKKLGDSLAGRFFSIRLNPLDLKELKGFGDLERNYSRMVQVGGFPEPFFNGTERFYNLWQKSHSDLIVRQDLLAIEQLRDLDGIETLIEMLAQRVGSTISFNSLSEDLQRDDKTIKRWIGLLEQMYIIFRVSPFAKNISRGIKKAGKYYFYDIGKVQGDEAAKLENLVALSLKKELEFQEDVNGVPGQLYFLKLKDGPEIDFMVTQRKHEPTLIEVKLSDGAESVQFRAFAEYFPKGRKLQLVKNLDRQYTSKSGVAVKSALVYLENLSFKA